jgi:hypothetical protein
MPESESLLSVRSRQIADAMFSGDERSDPVKERRCCMRAWNPASVRTCQCMYVCMYGAV